MYKAIFVDQCGYLPQMKKRFTVRSETPVEFSVFKSDRSLVCTGKAEKRVEDKSSGETVYIGEFSQVTESGCYYIAAEGCGESDYFTIGESAFSDVFQKSVAFFYLQRCGQDLPKDAAGLYAHKACHTQIGHVYGSDKTIDVGGGWHDAGDYGRYVVPGAMAVAQLLYAFERNAELCGGYKSPCDSENQNAALSPFLSELKYELDWMIKMQREDGALYHKATCHRFCGFIMPQDETQEMVVSPVSVTATADFAAVCAMAVRFYKDCDGEYAVKLEGVARKAYKALKSMELPGGFKNPEGVTTGEYGDPFDIDERYWAAAELYKAFGDAEFRDDFEKIAREKIFHGYGWGMMGSYGNYAYLTTERAVDEKLKAAISAEIVSFADRLFEISTNDGYGTAIKEMYHWGSNMNVANNGLHLYDAFCITGQEKYLDAAAEQLHYLLGRNPMGVCYVTGCGTHSVYHPHHRPSGFVGKAMPGMLSGGPCSWLADGTAKSILGKNPPPPAKCFVDMVGSHSTNEVTIYWNSAFVALLATLCAKIQR